ncbi:MAG: phenylpyruvate tautomerase MIF-related protein, partial [Spirochaetaceae bacterium]|nr:phenylpyruvate tautomerase MIF-related protein [Spirochaetaceae bacterium]
MPYIAFNTSLKLTAEQKEKVKAEFGRLITIIPTKTEAGLLVDFSDGRTMYRAGEAAPCAFIEIRLFGKAEMGPKKKFTEEVFQMLNRELGLEIPRMYLNILEFENWGSAG